MIAAHLEPKGLDRDIEPIAAFFADGNSRDDAVRGSRKLRDALWKVQGYKPPVKAVKAVKASVGICPACLGPIGPKRHLVAEIKQTVASYYGLSTILMTSNARRRDVARARQQAMYLASELTKLSIAEIGRRFNRDHTTVLYAISAVVSRSEIDDEEAFNVALLREMLA